MNDRPEDYRVSKLTYSAITASGRAFDIEFSLHPQTRSQDTVSALMTGLLETLSRSVETQKDVSDGDVLQALAMVLAIRGRMIDSAPETVEKLVAELFATAFNAAKSADVYVAGRS